ncbi:MAG: tRNA dihydrouridine synthase DusB [Bacilli bacterium]|nr:tRNA dihydrouridine synthase DusB [Bacilli bacterium]
MEFKIGNIEIKNNVVLAPMAGISNPAYMKICQELGVGFAITELISSEAIVRGNEKTFNMLNGIEKIKMPVAIQIFGSNPDVMAKAAKIINQKYPGKIIDINMGCPVPKVAIKAHSGSALLKDSEKAFEIVKAVVKSVNTPVTVKIRSGWDKESINAVEISKIIEKAGASAITIHARTRSQGYSGKVDLDIIKKVKENVNIPVIGNGDIRKVEDAKHMIDYTGCDGVMIGRAALGNPWILENTAKFLKGQNLKEVSVEEKKEMTKKHFKYLLDNKNERNAILEMRTIAAYYLKALPGSLDIKRQIFKVTTKEELFEIIDKI